MIAIKPTAICTRPMCGHNFAVHRPTERGYECRRCSCKRSFWR